MTKQTLIITTLLFLFYSCDTKQNTKQQENKNILTNNTTDSIPESDLRRAQKFYDHILIKNSKQAKQINLNSINYHFDSLQIRLWNIAGLFPNNELYLITKTNSIWSGTYYDLQADKNYITGSGSGELLKGPLPLEIHKSKSIKPKLGWAKFIDSLISLNIMTLPDMSEVPNMKVEWTHSSNIIIEVSTKDNYRFYRYSSPNQFAARFWQARKVLGIESLFYTEFFN
jgi:hypothetical protein